MKQLEIYWKMFKFLFRITNDLTIFNLKMLNRKLFNFNININVIVPQRRLIAFNRIHVVQQRCGIPVVLCSTVLR